MTDSTEPSMDYLVQYVVVRKDLMKDKKVWNQGAIIAQVTPSGIGSVPCGYRLGLPCINRGNLREYE